MEKRLKHILISLIIFSILAKFALPFFNEGMWWDEAVYLGLGRNVQKGMYSLDSGTALETFRPPVFPLLISLISDNILLARILVVLISAISVVTTYYLSKELFGKDIALLSSLFLSTNQLFVFFSTKILSEPLFMSFLSLSLLFFLRRKKPTNALVSGVFAGLALMTRYLGTIIILSYALYFVYIFYRKKSKRVFGEAAPLLLGFLAVLSPWLLMSYAYYGSIFGAYLTNLAVYSESLPSGFSSYFADIFGIFGVQIIFVAIGLYVLARQEKSGYNFLLYVFFLLPLAFFSLAFHREPRYLLSYMPIYAIFAGLVLKLENKKSFTKYLPLIAVLVCAASLFTGLVFAWNDRFSGRSLVEASVYLKNITDEKDAVMTESYPYVYYFSERRAIRFPDKYEDIGSIIEKNGVKFILVYKFEPGNPDYVDYYFDGKSEFIPVKKFEQWGDENAAVIYRFYNNTIQFNYTPSDAVGLSEVDLYLNNSNGISGNLNKTIDTNFDTILGCYGGNTLYKTSSSTDEIRIIVQEGLIDAWYNISTIRYNTTTQAVIDKTVSIQPSGTSFVSDIGYKPIKLKQGWYFGVAYRNVSATNKTACFLMQSNDDGFTYSANLSNLTAWRSTNVECYISLFKVAEDKAWLHISDYNGSDWIIEKMDFNSTENTITNRHTIYSDDLGIYSQGLYNFSGIYYLYFSGENGYEFHVISSNDGGTYSSNVALIGSVNQESFLPNIEQIGNKYYTINSEAAKSQIRLWESDSPNGTFTYKQTLMGSPTDYARMGTTTIYDNVLYLAHGNWTTKNNSIAEFNYVLLETFNLNSTNTSALINDSYR